MRRNRGLRFPDILSRPAHAGCPWCVDPLKSLPFRWYRSTYRQYLPPCVRYFLTDRRLSDTLLPGQEAED